MQKYMNFKEIGAYSLGLFGFQMIVGLLNSYQAEFYHEILGADLAIVGILICVVKILSSVFDPFVGNMISRKGKLKPFILYAIVPLAIMTVVVFLNVSSFVSGTMTYVWIFVTFLLWSMAMTIGDVPSQGISSVLTPNPDEKASAISTASTFKEIGFSASAVVVPVVCLLIKGGSRVLVAKGEKDSPINAAEYLGSAIACAVIGCVLLSLIYFFTKERVPYSAEKMSMKEMLVTLKSNKPLILVVISYIIGAVRKISLAIQVQAANVILGSQQFVLLFGICMGVGSVLSMLLVPVFIKKFGVKKATIIVSLYGFVISMLAVLIYVFVSKNIILMFIMLFLSGLQFGVVNIVPFIMVADCVDYHEYKTGKRIEGPAFSVLTLTVKIGLALSAAIGLAMLKFANYEAATDFSLLTEEVVFTKNIVYFTFVGLPGIGSLLSLIPLLKYDLTDDKKAVISAELQARREKAKQ